MYCIIKFQSNWITLKNSRLDDLMLTLYFQHLTKSLTAGVTRTLTAVLVNGGELLVRLAKFPHTAAWRQAWRVTPVRLTPPGEASLQELLLIVLLLRQNTQVIDEYLGLCTLGK